MTARRISPVDAGLLALCLAWCGVVLGTTYVPTQDGPSHVYNAHVLTYIDEAPYSLVYEAAWDFVPNLAGTAVLMALGAVFPWEVAEQILVLLATLGFIAGFRILCRTRAAGGTSESTPAVALLGVPIALAAPLFYGFYGYSLGLALVPWIWTLANDERPAARAGLATLAMISWFCHAAACLVGLVGAAIYGLSTHRRSVVTLTLALLPTAGLMGWYTLAFPGGESVRWELTRLFEHALLWRALFPFDGLGEWTSLLCVGAAVLAVVSSNPDRRSLLLASALTLLYLALPDGSDEHWFLSTRLSVLPLATVAVAGAQTVRSPRVIAGALATVAALHLATIALGYWESSHVLEDYVALEVRVPDRARLLILDDAGPPAPSRAHILLHAGAWIAVKRGGIDVANYEPHRGHFQTRLSKYARFPEPNALMGELTPDTVAPFLKYADVVLYRSENPLGFEAFPPAHAQDDVQLLTKNTCRLKHKGKPHPE